MYKKPTGIRFLLRNFETERRKSSGDFILNNTLGTKNKEGYVPAKS